MRVAYSLCGTEEGCSSVPLHRYRIGAREIPREADSERIDEEALGKRD